MNSIFRRMFEHLRAFVRRRRAVRLVPDPYWREVCVRNEIPLSSVALLQGGGLELRLGKTCVRLTKTPAGMAVAAAHRLLKELDDYCDCEMVWDEDRDGLRLRWGRVTYFADCLEEIYILSELYLTGDYDFVPCGDTVVMDIGANVGFTAIFLADLNPGIAVECYEPLAINCRKLNLNLELNPHLSNRVLLNNFGLYSDNGEQLITSEVGHRGMSSIVLDRRERPGEVEESVIKVMRASDAVKDVLLRHANRKVVVKMDCEGSEYAIFSELSQSGMLSELDFVVMEWHRIPGGGSDIEALRELLVASGFNVYLRGRTQWKLAAGMAVAFRSPN